MKKSILFASALVLGLTFTSCSKDEDGAVGSVEGKWSYSKYSMTSGGITTPEQDYMDNEAGCSKDYIELLASGVSNEGDYFGSDCALDITTGTWAQSGNTVTLSIPGDDSLELTVVSVSSTKLKVKETYTDVGTTYTINLTLVKE
jgi:hypothetical protein